MSKRALAINKKYISDAIGYCHYHKHEGALNREMAFRHKCLAKRCKYLERYDNFDYKSK